MALREIVLRVEPQGRAAFEHAVSGDELVIGRSSKSGLTIPDPYLSRRQARLFRGADGWYLENLGGRNPTLLNGVAVAEPTRLSVGDLIKMSETLLRVAPASAATQDSQTPSPSPADSGALYRPAAADQPVADAERGPPRACEPDQHRGAAQADPGPDLRGADSRGGRGLHARRAGTRSRRFRSLRATPCWSTRTA